MLGNVRRRFKAKYRIALPSVGLGQISANYLDPRPIRRRAVALPASAPCDAKTPRRRLDGDLLAKRVLPIPGSPERRNSRPWPLPAWSSARRKSLSSRSRPTKLLVDDAASAIGRI